MKILLIDDTPEIAELLSYALRDRGYQVAVSSYVTDINELIVQEQARAVVLDCTILPMSEALFDTVRSEPAHESFPVVIISDTPEQAVASLRARLARHVRIVRKPFSGSQVVAALEQLLEPAS